MGKKKITTLLRTVAVAIVLLSALGCSKKPTLPETFPVRGKAVFPDGQPVPGGAIRFESQSDATVVANGEIGRDGTFTVSTFKVGVRAPGAIAGPHRVIVIFSDELSAAIPSRPGIPAGGALSVVLPKPFTIQPKDNEFTLTVPKPSR
jgi:hypothetical protein